MPPEERPVIIAVSQHVDAAHVDTIKAVDPRVRVVKLTNNDDWLGAAPNAEILMGVRPRRHEILRAPDLRWVHQNGAGVDRIIREVTDTHVILTNSHVHAEPISEHVFALLLAHTRRMGEVFAAQAAKQWGHTTIQGDLIAGRTMGILGLGHIGTAVAVRAHAFGMKVWGMRRRGRPMPGIDRVVGTTELDELLAVSDVLVVTLPLTRETEGLLDGQKIALLPQGAFVINIGRGAVLDEGALTRAVREGRLSGAALDVFAEEPLGKLNPIWTVPNLIVSPHISGNFPQYMDRVTELFTSNLRKYLTGQPLANVVDTSLGY